MDNRLLFFLAGVPALGIVAQWIAWRFKLPSILVLLAFGFALGYVVNRPDSLLVDLVGFSADDAGAELVGPKLLFPIVSLSVAVILFEGGMTLRIGELRQAGGGVLRLCTLGVLVSWILTAFAACWIVGLPPAMGALIGAILVVTGPTVIAPLLRHIKPTRRIGSMAKWEGIVVDPIGAILAVLVFQFIVPDEGRGFLMVAFLTLLCGCVFGLGIGVLLVQLVKRYMIPDFLHGVTFLAVALAAFAISDYFQPESGLVTVTLLGIYLANQKHVSLHHVIEFKEHLRVLLISCLFIVLGSRMELGKLWEVGFGGVAFVIVMILVVRPASVFLATIRSDMSLAERGFMACLAPRGIVAAAVTAVFALEIEHHLVEASEHGELSDSLQQLEVFVHHLEPLTFMVIVGTVLVYGLLAGPLARKLKLAEGSPQGILFAGAEPWICKIAQAVQEEGFQVLLVDTNYRNVVAAKMDGLPAECVSILSEHVREELDLGGIGRLLALTPNDEVNAMAAREFTHLFGRPNVYQLTPWDSGSKQRQSIAEHLRGRLLFGEDLHHDELAAMVTYEDFEVKKTRLSEEFTIDEFQKMYEKTAVLLFLVENSKKLSVCTADGNSSPRSGDTVIGLIRKNQEDTRGDPK